MDLTGVRTKLDRAEEHLQALHKERTCFLESQPYAIHWRQEGHEYVGRVQVMREPPDRISAIFGDYLQNLRASLDHLVWELARGEADRPPGKPQFPIVTTDCAEFEKNGAWRIKDVPEPQRTEIKALQPYHAGDDAIIQPLAVLAELSNEDKHRRLVFTGAITERSRISLRGQYFAATTPTLITGPFVDGAVFGKFFVLPTDSAKAAVSVDYESVFNIQFDVGELFGQRPMPNLLKLQEEVIRVVALLT